MDTELQELKDFFASVDIPKETINISPGEYIFGVATCIKTAITTLEYQGQKPAFAGYWERLYKIKAYIENNSQAG